METRSWLSPLNPPQRRRAILVVATTCHQLPIAIFLPQTEFNRVRSQRQRRKISSAKELWQQAWKKGQQQDYASAIALLTQLLEHYPTQATHYNNRGLFYFHNGQPLQALADYNLALKLNPHLPEAYTNRANFYAYQGQLKAALADYDTAIDLNPFNIRAWINRGVTYRNLKLYETALDQFDFALRMGQLVGHVYAERGRTYHQMGDWNRAIADYKQALAHLTPDSSCLGCPDQRQCQRVKTWLTDLLEPLRA